MSLPKAARLQLLYEGLAEAPACASESEAFNLLTRTLLDIEDKYSGIERGTGGVDDGRMYPPLLDSRRVVADRNDIVRYRSKAHNAYISRSGSILIVSVWGGIEFTKAGIDGVKIAL